MSVLARAFVMALFFVLVVLSGLWLSRSGRPLAAGISAVHKLISLGAGVFLLVTVIRQSRLAPLGTTGWIAVGATGLCFLIMVASGGLLSADKPMPAAVLRVHQIVPALTVLSSAATLYLLLGR